MFKAFPSLFVGLFMLFLGSYAHSQGSHQERERLLSDVEWQMNSLKKQIWELNQLSDNNRDQISEKTIDIINGLKELEERIFKIYRTDLQDYAKMYAINYSGLVHEFSEINQKRSWEQFTGQAWARLQTSSFRCHLMFLSGAIRSF